MWKFFLKTLKYSSGQVECNVDNPDEDFSLTVRKLLWNHNFYKKNFLKMFLWLLRMQSWQPCGNFSAKSPKTFCSKSENKHRIIIFPKKILKKFTWTRKMQFLQPYWNLFLVSFWKKLFFGKKLIFSQNRLRWQICCKMRITWFHFVKLSFPP